METNGLLFKQKLEDLREKLLAKHPTMPVLLQEIHKTLRMQPENMTLCSEEEINAIFEGLKVQTGVEFVAAVKTSKKKVTTADLGF